MPTPGGTFVSRQAVVISDDSMNTLRTKELDGEILGYTYAHFDRSNPSESYVQNLEPDTWILND